MNRETPRWPDPLDDAAYSGLAGDFVRLVAPHTEADPVALLAQFLAAVGNLIGPGPHFVAERDRHGPRIFVVLVGETAKGRKGSAWGQVRDPLRILDADWAQERVQSGLSSGEGLIWAVRDPISRREPVKRDGRTRGYEVVQADPGIADKRLLVYEPELASTLRVLDRDGNTLSAQVRQAWDSGTLRVLTKNTPATATGAHISVVGHITSDELRRYLDRTEAGNGFANRFLWICVRRARVLPDGGALETVDFAPFLRQLRAAVDLAKRLGPTELRRDTEARALWHEVYPALSEGRPGLLGAVTSRAEAQAMRLALIYALLDESQEIRRAHLRAALELWRYADASARFIFGDALGDPVADEILAALRAASAGLTRTQISKELFGRHRQAADISRALGSLAERGLVTCQMEGTLGRSAERWRAAERAAKEANDANEASRLPSPSSLSSQAPGEPDGPVRIESP